ncbi:hypothetical protein BJY04DRAFT_193371 [Aspergillus karnatakaensis]|uniref:uncharacterized protein n=1 Tax=Aspergillus karnatakaensis TaxID=1810916 RepID=UPI003CCE4EA5
MAKVMNGSQSTTDNDTAESPSSRTVQGESSSSFRQDTTEAFNTALRNILEVAELISSGVKSKLPELERHLDNARRSLPRDITDNMRNAFLVFEQQVKAMATTLNNLPETLREVPGGARRFPEFPTPADAMHGLREMGAQLNSMSQTLLDAFDSSLRGAFPNQGDGFFNFPGFFETNNQASASSSTAENPSVRRDNNVPAAYPNHHNTAPQPAGGAWVNSDAPSNNFYWGHHHPHRLYNRPYLPPTSLFNSSPFYDTSRSGAASQPRQTREQPSAPPSHDSNPTNSLFVGNVGFNVTERMIKDVFSSRGFQVEVNLLQDSEDSRHAGFGYLTFLTPTEAAVGLREMQGVVIDGHCINLEFVDHTPITSLAETTTATASSPQTSGVVRRDASVTNTTSDGPPSAAASNINQPSTNESVHDLLLAQTEARFPPVSQLDAHMLAEQSSRRQSAASEGSRNMNTEDREVTRESIRSFQPPGSFPQDTHDESAQPADTRPVSIPRPRAPFRHSHHHHTHAHPHHHPRRAATVRSMDPRRVSFNPYDPFDATPGLRRRATERHSLRGGPHHPMGLRHSASFHNLSQHVQEQPQNESVHEEQPEELDDSQKESNKQRKQRAIAECVSALYELGYGSEENGGLHRMEMYAMAADGEIFDAIDMIEEERKVYEQRG